jgi:microcin C transport system substrate-binding protein
MPARLARAVAAPARRHALAVFGDPELPPDFTHFPYVTPDAPKRGEIRLLASSWTTNQNPTSFDTFNMWVLRGNSPPFMGLCHATLMTQNLDEPDAMYGFVAEGVEVDGLRLAFFIRPTATFSDGSPITAADVAWTFETLKRDGHPLVAQPLDGVASVEAVDERTALVTLKEGTSNRLPPLVAGTAVLSRAYFETHDFKAATLDIPVGSGAYTVGDFRAGSWVDFRRRDDWWGDDVPAARGHNNFTTIRVAFYRERTVSFEAFKAGEVTFREEFTSKTWATEYDFPAIRDGRVVRREFPDGRPAGAQGFFLNTRRPKLADPRTREAIGYAFDFEWTNQNVFYGLYRRTPSFFVNSDMMAEGEPSPEEVTLLEPFRDRLPPAVFGPVWLPPTTDGSGRDRAALRKANELLTAAGWRREGERLVNDAGETLSLEYLYEDPSAERYAQPFASRLRLLGIPMTLRLVDSAQYQERLNTFDFDMTARRYSLSPTPSEVIRQFWSSSSANVPGSYNIAGISDPVVDALTENLLAAPTREAMNTAGRALDRVLRLGHYWVPQWYKATHTVAFWDRFGIPETKPRYDLPVETTWWAKEA